MIRLTKHAQEAISARGIAFSWIEEAVSSPAFRSRSPAMIRTSYDPEADAMFVWFGPEGVKSASTEEVSPSIMLDFDTQGRVIGIEVLDVSERMALPKAAA